MKFRIYLVLLIALFKGSSNAQEIVEYLNCENKIFSISFPNDPMRTQKTEIMSVVYNYICKFYDVNNVPCVNIILISNYADTELSYDLLEGSLINSAGIEGARPFEKAGIKIRSNYDIYKLLRLLDYGIEYDYKLYNTTAALIKSKENTSNKLTFDDIQKIVNRDIDSKKELYISKVTKRIKRKYKIIFQ